MKDSKYDMVRVNYMHMYIQIDDYCLALLSRLSTPYLVSRFPKPFKQIINCLFSKSNQYIFTFIEESIPQIRKKL